MAISSSFGFTTPTRSLFRSSLGVPGDSGTISQLAGTPVVEENPSVPVEKHNGEEEQAPLKKLPDNLKELTTADAPAEKEMSIFDIVASRLAICLVDSELKKDRTKNEVEDPYSVNNWISDESSEMLEQAMDSLKIKLPEERTGLDRDDASSWIRWMKSSPTPVIVDLCEEIREVANATISDDNLDMIDMSREEFLTRLGGRLLLFPSGSTLSAPLLEPPASMIYGKLLYGGITRSRILNSSNGRQPPRKTGERTDVKASPSDYIPVWMQYGGSERMYEALDMGPAAVLEIVALPKSVISRGADLVDLIHSEKVGEDMVIQNFAWKPQDVFNSITDSQANASHSQSLESMDYVTGYTPISQSGKDRNAAFESDFTTSVGGLSKQIDSIVRRVLDGRVIRPAQEGTNEKINDDTSTALSKVTVEAEELSVLGLTPVRGLLLYGPPGTGKTLLARQIAKALRAREPKIVSAPELLDRWVGGSEKLVRELFAEAEAELAACNGDATRSALHIVVIDEIDAVFRRRSSGEDSGESTRASVVNQILAKLDGVNAIDNVLMIGLTNRRELLDEALLRPGRLEVQIEVPLPDQEGRREILNIHFNALRKKGRLSKPLCCAIDGVPYDGGSSQSSQSDSDDAASDSAPSRKRDTFKQAVKKAWHEASAVVRPTYDLASDSETGGFSGAEISGLVRCAGSLALSRARRDGNGVEGLLITLDDVKLALKEVKP